MITKLVKIFAIFVIATTVFTGCAKEKYQAKPINSQNTTAKILAKDPLSANFKSYLIKQGYKESDLPFANWGLNELTLSALYHHPKLDVAKARLALAKAELASAGQKQNPTLNGSLARSNRANNDIRPWAYGLNVEIPIETTGKRQLRIEEAEHLVEVARIDVADVAWQLRSQLADDLNNYQQNNARQGLLKQTLDKHNALVKILEKRVALGALSNTDLSAAKLLQQKSQFSLDDEQAANHAIRAQLATNAGLTLEKFNQIQLRPLDIEATLAKQSEIIQPNAFKNLQEKALLNRLDIRRGLEKYAATEAKIKLEVAKQTPDISITPGFIFEFGDKIWSLGFSSLLNLLNKNQTLIAEATQLREIEGAQFELLQSQVIGDLSQASVRYQAALQSLDKAKQQQASQQVFLQKLNKQLAAGVLDRLELTQAALHAQLADEQVLAAQFTVLTAANTIENVMQRPLFDNFSVLNQFSRPNEIGKQ